MRGVCMAFLVLFALASPVVAEDLEATFAKVKEAAASGNFSKALKELEWMKRELEKGNAQKIATFFPDSLGGFSAKGQAKQEGALGMTQVQRIYNGPGGARLEAALTSGGMASGLGGLMALGQMGAMMGGTQPGSDMFRIGDLTAMMEAEAGAKNAKLTVTLKSGGLLTFELQNGGEDAAKRLKETVEKEFKVSELDAYLAG